MVRYYVRVFRLSEEDAEELAQDAFVRFFQAMDEYRGEAEWAFFETIARNLGYNRVRALTTAKRGVKPLDIDDPKTFNTREPVAPEGPDYAEREQLAQRRRLLQDAIAELPTGQRQCIQLLLDEFTYDEIARVLRISMDAVKSRIRDARRTLRERLGDNGAFPEETP